MANLNIPGSGGTSLSKASGAEINTGTDDAKYVTAKAIADSNVALLSDIPASWTAVVTSQSVGTGNTHDVTGIPTTAKMIYVAFNGVSWNGSGAAAPTVQLIVSGSPVNTGYNSQVHTNSTIVAVTTGFPFFHNSTTAAEAVVGALRIVCYNATTHEYMADGLGFTSVRSVDYVGQLSAAAQTTGIRLQAPGANNFDGGTVSVWYM
jgi:hypothetical protein